MSADPTQADPPETLEIAAKIRARVAELKHDTDGDTWFGWSTIDALRVAEQLEHQAAEITRLTQEREAAERQIADIAWVRDRLKADHEHACMTIAAMHAAAVGEVTGTKRGVIEDVEDVRKRAEQAERRERTAFEAHTALETKYRVLAAAVDHIDGDETLVDVFTTIAEELALLIAAYTAYQAHAGREVTVKMESTWQPIETAPKDGSRFLGGWTHPVYGWLWDQCHWQVDPNHAQGGYFYARAGGDPTHWMPLPPAPDTAYQAHTQTTP